VSPFYKRLALAILGMLLICGLGAVGLGWAVRARHRQWSEKILGEDCCARIYAASIVVLGTLFPADSDGDGLPTASSAIWTTILTIRWIIPP
jgi:hypothetical protein